MNNTKDSKARDAGHGCGIFTTIVLLIVGVFYVASEAKK